MLAQCLVAGMVHCTHPAAKRPHSFNAHHAGVSLDDVPMRRADNARILDTSRHGFQHSGAWRGEKVAVRRAAPEGGGGGVEVQTRLYVGKLPVAYKCVPWPARDIPCCLQRSALSAARFVARGGFNLSFTCFCARTIADMDPKPRFQGGRRRGFRVRDG